MNCTLSLEIVALSIITTTSSVTEEEPFRLKAKVEQEMLVALIVSGLKENSSTKDPTYQFTLILVSGARLSFLGMRESDV